MRHTTACFALFICNTAALLFSQPVHARNTPVATDATRDVVMTFEGADGTPLEAKLTLPADLDEAAPVVFYLHGAGPGTYENLFRYVDDNGEVQFGRYFDFHAEALARRGIGFFRMSKRGCHAVVDPPSSRLDRTVFSQATMSVLLSDYEAALDALRRHPDVDARRIVLLGASEGTRLAPRLAQRSPDGIIGIVMLGYAADNARDLINWQLSTGAWRGVQHLIPAAREGRLTRDAYDEIVKSNPSIAAQLPFEALDVDVDGVLTADDMAAVIRPRREAILQAVEDRNDDLLWSALLQLTSAYLLEWWDVEPNHVTLLQLDLPLAIFHGELDNTTRVEGVRETEAVFLEAGKTNLFVRLYPDGDHGLNWTWRALTGDAPSAYTDAFAWIARRMGDALPEPR